MFIKNFRSRISKFLVLFLLLLSFSITESIFLTKAYASVNNTYVASQGFSSTQGSGNWYYEQFNSSEYSNMTWNSKNNYWQGDFSDCIVYAYKQHPSTNASVRKWIAPQAGTVQIKGTAVKESAGGNGVVVSIKQNDTTVWGSNTISANDTTKGQYHNLIINVNAGDSIRFIVSNNGNNSYDCTLWDPTITYLEAYRASLGFSSVQGQNQWYYQQATSIYTSSYIDMTYTSSQWSGSYDNCLVGSNWQHPDTNVSIRKWVAPKAGRYKIFGTAKKQTAGGNGVILSIQQTKNYELWGKTLSASDTTTGVSHDVIVDLNANDTISFVVSDNGSDSYDTIIWDPTIVFLESVYASQYYSTTTQGQGNWYYQEWNGTSYTDMTWDTTYKWWRGSSIFTAISSNWQHPEVNDSVRKWVATAPGKITISGNVKLESSQGDGVIVSIKKNNTVLWGPVTISGRDIKSHHIVTDIAAGEAIYFIVNKNTNSTYDTTMWDPYISYGHDSLTGEGWSFGDTSSTVFTNANGVYEDGNIGLCRDSNGDLWAITGHTNTGYIKIFKGTTIDNLTFQYNANFNFTPSADADAGVAGTAYNGISYPDGIKSRGSMWPTSLWIDSDGKYYCYFHNETAWNAGGTEYTAKAAAIGEPDFRHIGLMTSNDAGKNWDFEGWVLSANEVCYTTAYRPDGLTTGGQSSDIVSLGAGDNSLYVDTAIGYLYMFYTISNFSMSQDTLIRDGIYVARASIDSKGMPGSWYKYYNGAFTEPGNMGKETPVLTNAVIPSVSYNSYLGKYVMVTYNRSIWNGVDIGPCPAQISTSTDLVNWSKPQVVDFGRTDMGKAYWTICNSDSTGNIKDTDQTITFLYNLWADDVRKVNVTVNK